MSEPTSNDRQKRGGPGQLRGAIDGKPFTSDQSHLTEAKKKAWAKKKLLKDLLGIVTSGKLGNSTQDYRKLASDFFGIKEDKVDVKMIMDFRQIEKAILKGDTLAYQAVMDRAYGKPKQVSEISGIDGKPIQTASVDLSKLSDEELRAIAEMQHKIGVGTSASD